VHAERGLRKTADDPSRWQEYFENLNELVYDFGPERARRQLELWRI